jgi:hypothetical protein
MSGVFQSANNNQTVAGLASSFPSVGSLTQAAVAQVGAVYQAAAAAAYQAVAASGLMPSLTPNTSSFMAAQHQLPSGERYYSIIGGFPLLVT